MVLKWSIGLFLTSLLSCLSWPWPAWGIMRQEIIATAARYAEYEWVCSRQNAKRRYNRLVPGAKYMGIPYNFGGFDSLAEFAGKLRRGRVAGNSKRRCGKQLCIRRDFAGVDCSGFLSRCWQIARSSTCTLPNFSIEIPRGELRPGDILNRRNSHVMLFDHFDEEGQMWVYESVVWLRKKGSPPAGVTYRAIDWDRSYTPKRYYKFIEIGDRVRSRKIAPVYSRPKSRLKGRIPINSPGIIIGKPKSVCNRTGSIPNDVFLKVRYDNGIQGWSSLKNLRLTGKTDLAHE
jgi:hypothetical protein